MTTGIVSGSFDPFTLGHEDIVKRASSLFDKVVILLGRNPDKKCLFPEQTRIQAICACFEKEISEGKIEVACFDGLLVDYVGKYENPVFVRGVRNDSDYLYETELAAVNKDLGGIDTVFLPADSRYLFISSTYARDRLKFGKSLSGIVPEKALSYFAKKD